MDKGRLMIVAALAALAAFAADPLDAVLANQAKARRMGPAVAGRTYSGDRCVTRYADGSARTNIVRRIVMPAPVKASVAKKTCPHCGRRIDNVKKEPK